jgi:hypothetical protein
MSTRSYAVRLAVGLGVLLSVAAVCNPPLDTEGLEPQLEEQLEDETQEPFRSVSCPDDVQPEAGGTFECVAVNEADIEFTIRVTQVNDAGRVEWQFVDAEDLAPQP